MLPRIASIEAYRMRPTVIKESWDDEFWPKDIPSYLVKVADTAGSYGIGEVSSQPWYYGETAEKLLSSIRLYERVLTGLEIGSIARAQSLMEGALSGGMPGSRGARSAVDMALYDLLGKTLSVPVYTLLGGAVRTDFDMLANLYHKSPETMAMASKELVNAGYKGLKIKIGDVLLRKGWSRDNLQSELERLEAALSAVPDSIYIDADANQGWRSAKWTVNALRRFEKWDNLSIEQPLHYADLEGAAFVRAHAVAPLILDESVWSTETVSQIIRMNACDRIVLKLGRVGGLYQASQIIAICEAASIGVSLDTSPYTLVGDTASCHAAAIVPTPYPVDCDGHVAFLSMGDPGPFTGGVSLKDGRAYLSNSPGLGIDVDWKQLGAQEARVA